MFIQQEFSSFGIERENEKLNTKNGKCYFSRERKQRDQESETKGELWKERHELCMCRCWLSAKEWIYNGSSDAMESTIGGSK